ncbi:MAG: hypothetical protein ACSHX8_10035 [Opitutaceae bacterium]
MIKRYTHYALTILLSLWITSGTAHGKLFASESKSIESPKIRALAIGLEGGLKDLEILDANLKSSGKLSLRQFAFSKTFTCPIVDGEIRFGVPSGTSITGKKKFRQVASFKWKDSYEQVCLLFLPKSLMVDDSRSTIEYTIQLINMSTDSFELGHTKIVNLTPLNTIVNAGEHNATVAAWDRLDFPKIEKTTGVNMAQLDVSYIKEGTEHNAYQTRMRYQETTRYITIIYTDTEKDKVSVCIVKDFGRFNK